MLATKLQLPSIDVGTADGLPALIVPPSAGPNGMLEGRDGLVLLVRDGVRIAIMARGGQSAAELVAIANSLG